MEIITQRVRELQEKANLPTRELASKIGISVHVINRALAKGNARVKTIESIAKGLNVDIADITERQEASTKLKTGQSIRFVKEVLRRNRKNFKKEGKIEKVYSNYILLNLKDYKTCINFGDLIAPRQYRLQIKENGEWIDANIKMLEG